MTNRIVITVEGGVDRPNAEPSMHEAYLPKLRAMKHGDSFFVPDLLSTELVGLIAFARDAGIYLNTVALDNDVIYRIPGTRVWCVTEAEFQPLTATGTCYYLHIRTGMTYKVRADIPPSKDSNVVRIGEAEYLQRPDYTGKQFNWMDADGTTWWKNEKGEPIAKPEAEMLSGQHQRIDKANYEALLYSLGKLAGQDGSFIGTPAALTPHTHDATKLPDRKSHDEMQQLEESNSRVADAEAAAQKSNESLMGYNDVWYMRHIDSGLCFSVDAAGERECAISDHDHITRDEYIQYVQSENLETYWRKVDGTIVEVPAAKIYAAMKTKGAVEVGREVYGAWLAAKSQVDDEL